MALNGAVQKFEINYQNNKIVIMNLCISGPCDQFFIGLENFFISILETTKNVI